MASRAGDLHSPKWLLCAAIYWGAAVLTPGAIPGSRASARSEGLLRSAIFRRLPLLAVVLSTLDAADARADGASLEEAQRHFYNARYEAAAEVALVRCAAEPPDIEACELRSSALHFLIKRALGEPADKGAAFKQCAVCQTLMLAFLADTARGQDAARARLAKSPDDLSMRFLLGKLDLNYLWLQLGTLGRRTGWGEYWEAKRLLDGVLEENPGHVRARVARAWMDYIVGTRVPRMTRWLLGGGDRKRGLRSVREAASIEADVFDEAEAGFALWEMQVRERDLAGAVDTARGLARNFPENGELAKFLATHAESTQ